MYLRGVVVPWVIVCKPWFAKTWNSLIFTLLLEKMSIIYLYFTLVISSGMFDLWQQTVLCHVKFVKFIASGLFTA